MKEEDKNIAGVIAQPSWILLGAILAGVLLNYFWPLEIIPDSSQLPIGLGIIALAIILSFLGTREFRRFGTKINPHRPTTTIITSGPFRYTRNPLYLSHSFFHIGIGIAVDNVWILGMLAPTLILMWYGVISREEHYLERKFGDEYLKYKASVRRWF